MTTELVIGAPLEQVEIPGVQLTRTGMLITDADLPFESLEQVVALGAVVYSAGKFWIGDALNFGERVFGERYAQMEAMTGLNPHTLENISSVCRRVAVSRRRESLSFSHHDVVARLEPREQVEWLEAAEREGWRVDEFRAQVKDAVPVPSRGEQPLWTSGEKQEPELLTFEAVEQAEAEAKKTLDLKLPANHPLWETQAKARAKDALDLAATAKETLREVVADALAAAQPYGNLGFWIPTADYERLRALVEEGGTE